MRHHNPHHIKRYGRNSPVIKFYEKVWGFDPAGANFCKLFWACVVFAPAGVLYWLILNGASAFGTKVAHGFEWLDAHTPTPIPEPLTSEELKIRQARWDLRDARRAYRLLKRERRARIWGERAQAVQERFANGADRVAAFFQHPVPSALGKIILIGVPLAFIVTLFVVNFWETLLIFGCTAAVLSVGFGFVALLESGILGGPAKRVGSGITGAGNFVIDGIFAIKDRTCPGIEVEGVNQPQGQPARA